jgi:PAS domain S-box-containing protein
MPERTPDPLPPNVAPPSRVREARDVAVLVMAVFEQSTVGVAQLDSTTGRFVRVNQRFADLLGYTRDEMEQLDFQSVTDPDHLARDLAEFERLLSGEIRGLVKEKLYLTKDGGPCWVNLTVSPLWQPGEPPSFHVAVAEDITDRKTADALLRESEAKYRALFVGAPLGILVADVETHAFTDANPAICRMLGYGEGELLRLKVGDIHPADHLQHVFDEIAAHLRGDRSITHDLRCLRKDGSEFTADVSTTIVDVAGRTRLIGFFIDTTERRRAEEASRERQRFLDRIVNASPDLIYIYDLVERRNVYANQESLAFLGYDADRIATDGASLMANIAHPDDLARIDAHHARCATSGDDEVLEIEYRLRDAGGRWRWMRGRDAAFARGPDGRTRQILGVAEDISERRAAEEELRESHWYLEASQRAARLGWYALDLAAGRWRNSALLDEIFGISDPGFERDVAGWMNIVHPDDRAAMLDHLQRHVIEGRHPFDRQYRVIRLNDGEERWVHGRGDLTFDASGAPVAMIGVIQDITERKRAEEELRISRQWLDLHVQQTPLGVVEFDLEGRVREWNPAAVRTFGYTRDEAIGQHWTFMAPQVTWGSLDGVWEQLVNQRGGSRSTNENRTKSGEIVTCEWFNTPLVDQHGRAIGVASLVMDVTNRKRAEDALRASESKYRALHESLMDALVTVDLSGRIIEFNQVYRAMLGYSDEELRRLTYVDLTPDSWHAMEARITAEQLMVRGYSGVYEKEYRRKDGTVFPVELRTFLVRDEQGGPRAMWAIVRDISERKHAEAERARLEEQVRQSVKMESIGRLAGGVAHDFNNMLQAILGNVDFALAEAPAGSGMIEYLGEIRKSAERSADLTRQLLAFARKQTISPRILDLNDTVSGMLKMLLRLIGEDIELHWSPGAGVWPVKVDPGQIDQILANLTVNARDAIEGDGRITIETANVTIDSADAAAHPDSAPGEYVMLAVSDTGRGLDESVRAHLFEPFFTTKGPGKGTGLGLATVFGIIRQNNGFIDAASEPGHGTTFRLYLPRAAAAMPDTSPQAEGPAPRGTETVLVVEDEEQVLTLSRQILERNGYTVLTARSPDVGLALAASSLAPLHMLVTDVVMPGMNGKELLDRLRVSHPGLKCLFMSGYTADVIAHHGILDEGIQFLQKPFTAATLAARVRDVLGR